MPPQLNPDAWSHVMLWCRTGRDAANLRLVCKSANAGWYRALKKLTWRFVEEQHFLSTKLQQYCVALPARQEGAYTHFTVCCTDNGQATLATMHRGAPADACVVFAPNATTARIKSVPLRLGDESRREAFCRDMGRALRFMHRTGRVSERRLGPLLELCAPPESPEYGGTAPVRRGSPLH